MLPTGWRIELSSVVVVVVARMEGSCLSSTVVQAENERKAAVARQQVASVFIIESWFDRGLTTVFIFFGAEVDSIDASPAACGVSTRVRRGLLRWLLRVTFGMASWFERFAPSRSSKPDKDDAIFLSPSSNRVLMVPSGIPVCFAISRWLICL